MPLPRNNGECPQCLLDGIWSHMLLNHFDFWECPKCYLQAWGNEGFLVILKERGIRKFREEKVPAFEHLKSAVLMKQTCKNFFVEPEVIQGSEDLTNFISNEVEF